MKKVAFSALLIVIPLWVFFYFIADNGIEFDDKLEKYLQKEFQTTDLSKEFALSVESLDLSNENLTSAKGLEHFTNLKKLDLSDNLITDSSFLNELKNLTDLNLNNNQLESIDQLNSPNLEKLEIKGNRLQSLDFIIPAKKLLSLNIRDNDITDLSPLDEINHLKDLNIRGNQVESIEALAIMKELTDLNARNNQIHSIKPIVGLPLTDRLYVTGNSIQDFDLLSDDKLKQIEDVDFEKGLPTLTFKQAGGIYDEPFQLEIEADKGYDIYYTLDGSVPNASSKKYEEPIDISKDLMYDVPLISNYKTSNLRDGYSFLPSEIKKGITITAAASKDGGDYSDPVTATYILDAELATNSELPVVSITVDPSDFFDEQEGIYVPGATYKEGNGRTGNYYQKGRETEKEGSVELFDEDGTLNFQQDIGLRINGNWSRRLPQKSLRLYSRSDYGQSRFVTDIFEDLPYNEFNLLLLRNSGNDYNSTLLRDGLMHELIKDENVDVQAYQPALVLINGEYWGIQNIREKFNKDYIDLKYNIKEKDLALMKGYKKEDTVQFDMKAGSQNDELYYRELLDYVDQNDMTDPDSIKHVDTMMDIENYLEYVSYQVFYANTDSFSNNLMLWRKKVDYTPDAPYGHDGRWRWMLFDLDFGMGFKLFPNTDYEGDPVDYNMIEHVLKDEDRMKLFRGLMENEKVKSDFVKIMLSLLNNNFEPEHVKDKIDELSSVIRPEIPQSIERWENVESVEKWEENLDVLRDFAEKRPQIVKEHMMDKFEISEEEMEKLEEEAVQE